MNGPIGYILAVNRNVPDRAKWIVKAHFEPKSAARKGTHSRELRVLIKQVAEAADGDLKLVKGQPTADCSQRTEPSSSNASSTLTMSRLPTLPTTVPVSTPSWCEECGALQTPMD